MNRGYSGSGYRICYTPIFIDKINIEWDNPNSNPPVLWNGKNSQKFRGKCEKVSFLVQLFYCYVSGKVMNSQLPVSICRAHQVRNESLNIERTRIGQRLSSHNIISGIGNINQNVTPVLSRLVQTLLHFKGVCTRVSVTPARVKQ